MKNFNRPEIRMDDVLQVSHLTKHQKRCICREYPPFNERLFKLFLQIDGFFAAANYPCTLAICADGIATCPNWVDHIKRNIHRYKIELHCLHHRNYKFLPREEVVKELESAIFEIESTFGVKINTWYPPKGRKGEPKDKDEICKELGIKCYKQVGKVDAKLWLKEPDKYPIVNFHSWHRGQCEHVKEILKRCHKSEPNSING